MGPSLARLSRAVRKSRSFTERSPTSGRLAGVSAALANAWGTELLMLLQAKLLRGDELLRLGNNWAAVQTYYVCYHATHALVLAEGSSPGRHPGTQRRFVATWVTRPLSLPPWTLGAGHHRYFNLPPGRVIREGLHAWTSCDSDTCWDIAAKALRTTRADAIPEAIMSRRQQKRKERRRSWEAEEADRLSRGRKPRKPPIFRLPRLSEAEKEAVERGVRPYSLMDYLFRLRVKSNYEEARMFTEGPADDQSSRQVNTDLQFLGSGTLLLHELQIRQHIGRDQMADLIDGWVSSNHPLGTRIGVAARRHLILTA